MKKLSLSFTFFLITHVVLFSQSGMTIQSGGAVTVNGNLLITPFICGIPLTDNRDGKTYNTVLIGTQCWFAQNLNIGAKVFGSTDQINNGIIEKYCYNDDENNCNVYGGLYQWDEAMQYMTAEGVQGICPLGWHIPSKAESLTLTTYLGGDSIAGGKMKETGTSHWHYPNTGATNISGFTALPSGYRDWTDFGGRFRNASAQGYWWSSTSNDASFASNWYIVFMYVFVERYNDTHAVGYSVRCMKD